MAKKAETNEAPVKDKVALDLFEGEPKEGDFRIIRNDSLNLILQVWSKILTREDGVVVGERFDWSFSGYFSCYEDALRGYIKRAGWTTDNCPANIKALSELWRSLGRIVKQAGSKLDKAVQA